MSQKNVLSVVGEVSNLTEEYIVDNLNNKDLWLKIIPAAEKQVEIRAPNVIFTKFSEIIPIGLSSTKIDSEGELILEDKGKDDKGKLFEFHVRNSDLVKELEGRLRIRKSSPGVKIGIFISEMKIEKDFLGSIGQNAAELVLRNKLREMLELMKKL